MGHLLIWEDEHLVLCQRWYTKRENAEMMYNAVTRTGRYAAIFDY